MFASIEESFKNKPPKPKPSLLKYCSSAKVTHLKRSLPRTWLFSKKLVTNIASYGTVLELSNASPEELYHH